MKTYYLCLIVTLASIVIPGRAYAGWSMVFNDEFDGPELDRDAWFTRYIYDNGKQDHLTRPCRPTEGEIKKLGWR